MKSTKIKKFKAGDRVLIIPGTKYYTTSDYNPRDVKGTIEHYSGSSIYVKWDNGATNSYDEEDLKFAVEEEQYEIY